MGAFFSTNIKTLVLYGTEDGVVQRKKLEKGRELLAKPENYYELEIEGANHAHWAHYGAQAMDGDASISREDQIKTGIQKIKEVYNNILNKFKTKTDVPMSGKLKLVLVIKSELGSEILTGKYPISNTLNVEINLGDKTSNVKIIDSEGTKNSELLESYKEKEKDFVKYRFGVVVFICITLVFIFLGVLVRKEEKKNNYFFIRLKSILRNYDHIIVNVDATVSTKNYNVIKVKSFEELLDVHSEVRFPIYYYYKHLMFK